MPWQFNPFTGNFDFYYIDSDISGGLDNLLLADGTSFMLLQSSDEDVLLLN